VLAFRAEPYPVQIIGGSTYQRRLERGCELVDGRGPDLVDVTISAFGPYLVTIGDGPTTIGNGGVHVLNFVRRRIR
jgi:hypothetical protein